MTALILDGFDHYGSGPAGIANMLDGVWASVPTIYNTQFNVGFPSWGPARTGENCLICVPAEENPAVATIVVPGAPAIMYFSLGFALDFLPPTTMLNIFDVRDPSNVPYFCAAVTPTGAVAIHEGSDPSTGNQIAITAGPVIRSQTWHLIEAEVNFTAGTLTIRFDDVQASNTPAIIATIATGGANGLLGLLSYGLFNYQTQPNTYADDLFIRDSNGSVNNGFLGDRRIALLPVAADTSTAGWTPRFYQKFGTGVLQLANMQTNNPTPVNENANVMTPASTSLDTGSADFTLESFVRFELLPAAGAYATIFNRWDAINNHRSLRFILGGTSFNGGSLQVDLSPDGTTVNTPIVYPFTPDLNRWYHIALVRASNELLLFVDGEQLGLPIAYTNALFSGGSEPFSWGAEVGTEFGAPSTVANSWLTGMYDETRFTNGYARYTANFTPPATPFPRGTIDTEWADVVLLCGYDTIIQDESSFARTLTAQNGATQFTVNDGAALGDYTTVNKLVPDDNTFLSASLTPSSNIGTMTTQPANGDTVTVGTTSGDTAAVYTFKTAIASAYDVLIDTTAQGTLTNLLNAINAGSGVGTKYGSGTLANYDVGASSLPAGQFMVTAQTAGAAGNSIASTATGTAFTWATSTLTGGLSIPGPSDFKVQRPPPNTTIISAMQLTVRAYKTDSGTCSLENAFIGPLGTVEDGAVHSLATNVGYYNDILENDPDTGSPISPATIINGKLRINRTV
jgi:hypothetical protein